MASPNSRALLSRLLKNCLPCLVLLTSWLTTDPTAMPTSNQMKFFIVQYSLMCVATMWRLASETQPIYFQRSGLAARSPGARSAAGREDGTHPSGEAGQLDQRTTHRRGEQGNERGHVAGGIRHIAGDGVDPGELLVRLADGRR